MSFDLSKSTIGGEPAVAIIEWLISPPDYLEVKPPSLRPDCEFTFANGKITAHARADVFDSVQHCGDTLHKELETCLKTIQMLSHRPFQLSEPQVHVVHSDGRKEYFLFCKAGEFKLNFQTVDFAHVDSNGKILRDTKTERLDLLKMVTSKSVLHCDDAILQAMLKSYESALHEPNNELIHLYDIYEMGNQFPNVMKTVRQMRKNKPGASKLGRIANDSQTLQGRHRGEGVGKGLKVASKEELEIARSIATDIVLAYLEFLSQNLPTEFPIEASDN